MTLAPPALPQGDLQGHPQGLRYALDMARTEFMGIEGARKQLGERVDKARDEEIHTVLTRHGVPAAILVDPEWYRSARAAMADPATDLPVVIKPKNPKGSDAQARE